MKVIAQVAALQEALALAGSIVAVRTPKPVLQCVKLEAKGKTLTLLTTDLETACRYVVSQVEVQTEGEVLVPVSKFADIVRESAGEDAIVISQEKDKCVIKGAGSRFSLLGFDPAEFPAIPAFDDGGDFQVPANALAELIERTLFATAKAHSHYAISGVLWEATGKKLQLVATDGHRLALAKAGLPKAAGRDVTTIVPAKLMNLLGRISAGSEEILAVKLTDSQIMVKNSRATLMSTLVQGNFPKYQDVIPRESNKKATLQTQPFMHRLRQAALLVNEESRGVRLSFKGQELTLSSRTPETGEAEVNLPIKYTGDDLDIGFNPSFLTDALKVVKSEEAVMEFNSGNKPAVLKSGTDFVYVLMPVDLG